MNIQSTRLTKFLSLAVLVSAIGACTLPRPGPSKEEILEAELDESSNTAIVVVDELVNSKIALPPHPSFGSALVRAGQTAPDIIRPGDTLSFTIYENVDDGVLSRGGAGTSQLGSIKVDETGFIFIPYAGRIRAAGNTTEALRQVITTKLAALTPEPQVLVQRASGDGATVSILGDAIDSQGVYPVTRSSRRLMEMIATAGGITTQPELARITVLRNQTKSRIWFEDVYDHPEFDIPLHAGDRVLVDRDPRIFTVLGATGAQTNVPFPMRELSALEALAQVGGLDGKLADPTGIFIVRKQDAATARKVLNRSDIESARSIVYVLDLTKPTGIPLAQDFPIRDGDTVYVTEAPYIQWDKTLGALVATVLAVQLIENSK